VNGVSVAAVYRDAAESGATVHRPELQRLLAEAKGAGWAFVLVNDQSRATRNLESWLTLVRVLKGFGIAVVDCATGMRSTDPQAKVFGVFNGLQGEAYIEAVRDRTIQALEGRAKEGFWCGGRVYGYAAAEVAGDAKRCKVLAVEESEARIVRRIFAEGAEGAGFKAIAHRLNTEGIAAPYDRAGLGYTKAAGGRGWGHTTVRNILKNERYIGRVRWNRRQSSKDFDTGKRRYSKRSESEHIVREAPELAIVDAELWKRVQARLASRKQPGAPRSRLGMKPSSLSLLLRCGHCGGRMCIQGKSHGRRGFGCTAAHSKGTCPSKAVILEEKALALLGNLLRRSLEMFHGPDGARAGFEETERRARRTAPKKSGPDLAALDRAVRDAEGKARKVGELMLAQGHSATPATMLRDAEERVVEAKERRDAALATEPMTATPVLAYTPEQLAEVWEDLGKLFSGVAEVDPLLAQAELARLFESVTVTPRATPKSFAWELRTGF
jgi:site-specific DNA recombinase